MRGHMCLIVLLMIIACSKSSEKASEVNDTIPASEFYPSVFHTELDPFTPVETMSPGEVKILLSKMREADQKYRDSLVNKPPGREQYYMKKMSADDEVNLKLLDKIVHKFGWPGRTTFGEIGAETAWLIIWHQRDKRHILAKYHGRMEKAVKKGEMPENGFKLITDELEK